MVRSVVLPGGDRMLNALADVRDERRRQEEIGVERRARGIDWRSCADPAMSGGDPMRIAVLGEEYGEACRAVLERTYAADAGTRRYHETNLRTELIQVAAVAVAFVEAIDARYEEGNEA